MFTRFNVFVIVGLFCLKKHYKEYMDSNDNMVWVLMLVIEEMLLADDCGFVGMISFKGLISLCILPGLFILKYEQKKKEYDAKCKAFNETAWNKVHQVDYKTMVNNKGMRGEFEVAQELEKYPGYKKILYNVYVPYSYPYNADYKSKAGYSCTEIDAVMIAENGIHCLEIKNRAVSYTVAGKDCTIQYYAPNGTPSGTEKLTYNPLLQSMNHVIALRNYLGFICSKGTNIQNSVNVSKDKLQYITDCFLVLSRECKGFRVLEDDVHNYEKVHYAICSYKEINNRIQNLPGGKLTPEQIDLLYENLKGLQNNNTYREHHRMEERSMRYRQRAGNAFV